MRSLASILRPFSPGPRSAACLRSFAYGYFLCASITLVADGVRDLLTGDAGTAVVLALVGLWTMVLSLSAYASLAGQPPRSRD